MKKKPAKNKPRFTLHDDVRPISLDVSPGEIIALAQAHRRVAQGIPNRFAKYMNANRGVGQKDLKQMRDYMCLLFDIHSARCNALLSLVPDRPGNEPATEPVKG